MLKIKINSNFFKTLFCFLAVFVVIFGLSGCKDAVNQKQLIMVTEATFPPYEFRDGTQIAGIDPDIIREIAKRNGYTLLIEDINFDSIIMAIQIKKADVAASGITVTEERKKMVNFTIPYVSTGQMIIIKKDSAIRNQNDLKGKRIGVQHGTTGDLYVSKNIQEPDRYPNAALATAALLADKVDVVILDEEPAKVFVAQNPVLKLLDKPLTVEEYAFAIHKDRTDLLEQFNHTLLEMKKDGTLQQILNRYLDKTDESQEEASQPFSDLLKNSAQDQNNQSSILGKISDALHTNFVKNDRYKFLVKGLCITLQIQAQAIILGIIIGFIVAVIRSTADMTGKLKFANCLCKIYLTVIRGTPVVVQLMIIYFVIFGSVDVNKVLVAILAFGLNSGAYVAEIIRAGIISISKGQHEAGRSLGLSHMQTMTYIILPQALKNVLPALGNEFIVLLKETSVAGYIALQDLTKGGDIIRSQTYNAFLPLIAVALIYLIIVMFFTKLLNILEGKLKKNE